jgi:ribonuclease HII
MNKFDRTLIPPAPDLSFEIPLWQQGFSAAGLDEAGRGAWAGPVVAAAVILPRDEKVALILAGVRDSKQLTPQDRSRLEEIIQRETLWATGSASNVEIDELGILPATHLAMSRALAALNPGPDCLFLDALFLPDDPLPQTALIKGDQRSLSIAAASILAKTARDTWMVNAATEYPDFGFEQHKGYGTKQHQQNLAAYGPCPIHRASFRPIRMLLEKNTQESSLLRV